jgi:hypothetical protein
MQEIQQYIVLMRFLKTELQCRISKLKRFNRESGLT